MIDQIKIEELHCNCHKALGGLFNLHRKLK